MARVPDQDGKVGPVPGWIDGPADLCLRPLRAAFAILRQLAAFGVIVLATTLTKFNRARAVVHPLIWDQIRRAGLGLLPFLVLLSGVSGFVLIGQAMALLRQIGAQDMLGTVIVMALFRELAPLGTTLLVLLRFGTATVVELATLRAHGDVEALEALAIDPVHFLVVPRVIGLSVSVFCLTVYFLLSALAGGYLFCFLENVPLTPGEYLGQIARALSAGDFLWLILKTTIFGAAIAVITCYHGLARPLRLEQVPNAATRALSQSVAICLGIDALFYALYPLG